MKERRVEVKYICDGCESVYLIAWDMKRVSKETVEGPHPCRNRNCDGKLHPENKETK